MRQLMFRSFAVPLLLVTLAVQTQTQGQCKDAVVEKRPLADDVRFASPFYVIAVPKNAETAQMDNICYTYYEPETGAKTGPFNHIVSITNQDGSNKYYSFTKGDIPNRIGLAETKAVGGSSCTYHDHTLVPICNSTVFILYRCFIDGECSNTDVKPNRDMDSRVVLAATPTVSQECYKEVEKSLKDTSFFKGGDYIILPQKRKPQCVTKYNNNYSIGYKKAVGSKEVAENNIDRFGDDESDNTKTTLSSPNPNQMPVKPTQPAWNNHKAPGMNHMNNHKVSSGSSFQTSVSGSGYSSSFAFANTGPTNSQGNIPMQSWGHNNEWSVGPNPWNQPAQPGQSHYHMWQNNGQAHSQPIKGGKPDPWQGNNVFYHVHTWENPPPGCCKCNS